MMESGFYQFYISLADFMEKFVQRAEEMYLDDDFQALSMDQLRRPMIIFISLYAMAIIVFILEIIVVKLKAYFCNYRETISPI